MSCALLSCTEARPGPANTREPYGAAGVEPSLGEVLADPIVLAVMRRDRIGVDALWLAVHAAGADRFAAGDYLPLCA